jgi:hypothetical protein
VSQFLILDSRGCLELSVETVEGRPWARVSCTTGTDIDPVVGLRVVGTEDDGGMNLSSFDCHVNQQFSIRLYHFKNFAEDGDDECLNFEDAQSEIHTQTRKPGLSGLDASEFPQ